MADQDTDWLGDLRWQGYPKQTSAETPEPEDAAGLAMPAPPAAPYPTPPLAPFNVNGLEEADNTALRARVEQLTRLAGDFEKLLSEAGAACETAAQEAARERERLQAELENAEAGLKHLTEREAALNAELKRERELRSAAERDLIEARRAEEEVQFLRRGLQDVLDRRQSDS